MSQREKNGLIFEQDLDFSLETLQSRQKKVEKNDVIKAFQHIWEGGMPQVLGVDEELRNEYYNSYIDTYLMRDVTEVGGITDSVKFRKFLAGCAAKGANPVASPPPRENQAIFTGVSLLIFIDFFNFPFLCLLRIKI